MQDWELMETEVIYARVPLSLREAVSRFQAERGTSLTAAVVSLLAAGLDAARAQDLVKELQVELEGLRSEREALGAKVHESQSVIRELRAREGTLNNAYRGLAERIRQQVGTCPQCHVEVSGEDLIVATKCKNSHSLASMLQGKGIGPEYLFLVGAIGIVVGIAIAESKD